MPLKPTYYKFLPEFLNRMFQVTREDHPDWGFRQVMKKLSEDFPIEYHVWANELSANNGQPNGAPPAKLRRPRRGRQSQTGKVCELTEKQLYVMQIVSECKGNYAEAARRMGRDRKTVQQHHRAALAKLGRTAILKAKTLPLSKDRRGQVSISGDRRLT